MTEQPDRGRATLLFYGHNTRELGNSLPQPASVVINVKLDLRTPSGTATVKQKMRGQLAWLMEEGMSLPVIVDPRTGLATQVDTDVLERELAGGQEAVERQAKHESSLSYSLGLPTREELGHVGEIRRGIAGMIRKLRGR